MTAHVAHQRRGAKQAPQGAGQPFASNMGQFASNKRASRLRAYQKTIIICLAALLTWLVITRSLVAYLSDESPKVAYWLRATPAVLVNLADDKLNADARTTVVEPVLSPAFESARERSYAKGMQIIEKLEPVIETPTNESVSPPAEMSSVATKLSEAEYAEVKSWAERALRWDPLNARALRILAQLAERESTRSETEELMQGAVQRSMKESLAVFWMMRESYHNRNYTEAIRYADILLRTRPQLAKHVFPMLGRLAEDANAKVELRTLLATNPPWRAQFFDALPLNVTDARTPLELLLSLRDTPTPSTDMERRSFLETLVQHNLHELAYYTWLQFLPQEQLSNTGRLFNGGFETTPSGLLFDWVFKKGSGVNVKFATRPDRPGERALLLEFGPGRVDFGSGIQQLVLLPPGAYRLEGEYKADLVSQRGLQWTVRCAQAKEPIGLSTTMNGSSPVWQRIDLSFSVPAQDCAAQYVALNLDARSASEQFVSGDIWYDNLSLVRVSEPAQEPSEPQPQ